ncbi:MAG: polyprenyl synthetase family protein [Candidatus Thalassarchaeaceae archaeon]|nr:polyprenyl synthetase family protein [Candidatus Thalassarchaeaceae archaeon]
MDEAILADSLLVERRLAVEDAIEDLVASTMDGTDAPAMELAKEILLAGGKRIRPVLALLAYEICGGSDISEVMDFAVATELIHTATLIHDDVYDGAKLRRGVQTLHEKHGLDRAIIGGDFLFVLGFGLGGRYNEQVVRIMADTSASIANGELKQLQHVGDLSTTPEDYYQIVRGKTAGPFSSGCECAARIAGAAADEIIAMRDFGMELGIAFQLVDDLLDLTGDERMGKPRGTDVHEGKMTLPLIHSLTLLHGDGRRQLAELLSNFSDNRWDELESLLTESNSFEYCRLLIKNHLERALENLSIFQEGEIRRVLENLTQQVMTRHV